MINRAMQRFSYDRRNAHSLVALAVFMVHGIASIPLADAGDGRNQLPRKQHKDSDAPFLVPAEAVSKSSNNIEGLAVSLTVKDVVRSSIVTV